MRSSYTAYKRETYMKQKSGEQLDERAAYHFFVPIFQVDFSFKWDNKTMQFDTALFAMLY